MRTWFGDPDRGLRHPYGRLPVRLIRFRPGRLPNRRSLALLAVPIAVVLVLVRVPVVRFALRRERALYEASSPRAETGWPLPVAVAVLALATLVTALVA